MRKVNYYIVRHGETLLNKLGKAQGWVDSPLTDAGIETAQRLKEKLEGISFASVYSSDLQRAYQTAKIISKETNNIQIDPRLREWCLGSLEAEPTPIFLNKILSELNDISSEDLNLHLPEVCNAIHQIDTTGMTETFDEIACRLKECLEDIGYQALNTGGGNVLIVTHAFIIKTIVHLFDYDKLKSISKIANTSVTKICFNGEQFALEYSNMAY